MSKKKIKSPLTIKKHGDILNDFTTSMELEKLKYKGGISPSFHSLYDLVVSQLANKYYLTKGSIQNIIGGAYEYEEI